MTAVKLNALQTRTLALLQELAGQPDVASTDEATGDVTIWELPHAHHDHMHIGQFTVSARFASGLTNGNVIAALVRKGLMKDIMPGALTLTPAGLTFQTGVREKMLQDSDH